MYRLQKVDIKRASLCLASSFDDYPVFSYIIQDKYERKNKLIYIFNFLLKLGLLNGEVISNSNLLEGVSIWYSSKSKNTSFFDAIHSGLLSLYLKLDKNSFNRLIDVKKRKSIIRNELLSGSNYYFLDVLGINPIYQKNGIATELLNNKLNEIDGSGYLCYLETSNRENISYYNKFGFKTIKEYKIDELEVYCMSRKSVK
jgi:hypothetical protein